MSFDKKSVYHSALVRAGTIEVEITSDVLNSKYGKRPYINFTYCGNDHTYETENDECADALEGLKGKIVELTATGSRDDASIDIHVVGEAKGGGRQHQRQQRSSGGQRQSAPRQQAQSGGGDERQALVKAYQTLQRCGTLLEACLLEARGISGRAGLETEESIRAIATSLYIDMQRRVNVDDLPRELPPLKNQEQQPEQRQEQPRQQASRRREPEPEPEPQQAPPQVDEDGYADEDIPF